MALANQDIRAEIRKARIYNWEVAEALGIAEESFSRKLRREMPDKEKDKVRKAISKVISA